MNEETRESWLSRIEQAKGIAEMWEQIYNDRPNRYNQRNYFVAKQTWGRLVSQFTGVRTIPVGWED